jgi:hemerythrin-like domain-containing protein
VLIENVRHHVEEEEGELFPRIRKALGDERVQELGLQMEEIHRKYQA